MQRSFNSRNLERVVPLKHELELLHSYLYIEKERFGDRLKVVWDIPDCISVEVPPLSIQTIVENAVRHGVMARSSGVTIWIWIADEANYTTITVMDNGMGMSEEKLSQLLYPSSKQVKGAGLISTDRRLKQIYGYGLYISSELGQGTTVTFTIPKTAVKGAE
ncbi:sensor histidine kinase YesM [Paenibacillus castaneae]|uniref:sensor histidine kinase n=1 Tax=Paenibacillus castaneae TaxID=474957 RepID=UPI000C9A3F14|nr:ATP-binding protein [Paenibacillus castaneae]NIK79167.1 sensor histidine kinase YesM [Paenibacillus castaneae]